MKSYKEHLLSTHATDESPVNVARKPIYRSSAIFPVIESEVLHTQVLFMGYWMIKKHISQLGFLVSLRNREGVLIYRKNETIHSSRAFEIPIFALLHQIGNATEPFTGSIELEIFSSVDLVFPYPAFVVNYHNAHGSGLVHTTGRIYNDIEDLQANESRIVKEAGFDIRSGKQYDPFFAFVNGHAPAKNTLIGIELIDEQGNALSKDIHLGSILPLETVIFKLKDYLNVDEFLQGKTGTVKIKHGLTGFFPRFIAGNFCTDNHAVSITHTYYDNSANISADDYFENKNPDILLDSSIFVPVFAEADWYTHVKLYPIYSPSNHSVNLRFFDENGALQGEIENYIQITEKESAYLTLDINESIQKAGLDPTNIKGVQLYKVWEDKTKIPTRLKYGLNIGRHGLDYDLPTNICFNSVIANIATLTKKTAFKWMPLVNQQESLAIIQNSSYAKNYQQPANIIVSLHHTASDEILTWEYTIPANGQIRIAMDDRISSFLGGNSGWITVKSDNPFVTGWYFEFNESGIMGGDHSF